MLPLLFSVIMGNWRVFVESLVEVRRNWRIAGRCINVTRAVEFGRKIGEGIGIGRIISGSNSSSKIISRRDNSESSRTGSGGSKRQRNNSTFVYIMIGFSFSIIENIYQSVNKT